MKGKKVQLSKIDHILYEFNERFERGEELDFWLRRQLRKMAREGFKIGEMGRENWRGYMFEKTFGVKP